MHLTEKEIGSKHVEKVAYSGGLKPTSIDSGRHPMYLFLAHALQCQCPRFVSDGRTRQ